VVRLAVRAPATPVRRQVLERWSAYGTAGRAAVGSVVFAVAGVAAFQLWRPAIGDDGLTYHSAQPVLWLATGHPGALTQTLADFPTQAYPKTMEVLLCWLYAIGRTPLAAVPLTLGLSVLAAAAVVVALRRAGVAPRYAALAAAAGLLLPVNVRESSGTFSDLPALAWLACSVALSVFSVDEPATLGLAAVAGGLAIGTKPTTAPFVVVALAAAAWVNRDRLRSRLPVLALPAAGALVLAGLWYVVDWHAFGSPVWPFTRFPSGRPVPVIWREYGARFIHDPIASVRAAGSRPYLMYLAGALVLLAAVPVVALVALLPRARQVRRIVLVGVALIVAEVLLWADSEFTGLSHHSVPVVVTGLRYLIPAPLAAAALLALLTRTRSLLRGPAIALLVAALGLDVAELCRHAFGFPYRPSLPICVALVVEGALAGLLIGRSRRLPALATRHWVAPVTALATALVMAVPASSYVSHYLLVSQRHGFEDAPILSFLSRQPGWVHGDAPVAAGYAAYATLAGARFQHPLSFIPNGEPCPRLRAAARRGWVVIQPVTGEPFRSLDYVRAPACLEGIRPVAVVGGGIRIYAPLRLLTTDSPSASASGRLSGRVDARARLSHRDLSGARDAELHRLRTVASQLGPSVAAAQQRADRAQEAHAGGHQERQVKPVAERP
jgi:hypothetical protein